METINHKSCQTSVLNIAVSLYVHKMSVMQDKKVIQPSKVPANSTIAHSTKSTDGF